LKYKGSKEVERNIPTDIPINKPEKRKNAKSMDCDKKDLNNAEEMLSNICSKKSPEVLKQILEKMLGKNSVQVLSNKVKLIL
jgi:hypothetical protein